jgi:hypothetical protein
MTTVKGLIARQTPTNKIGYQKLSDAFSAARARQKLPQ